MKSEDVGNSRKLKKKVESGAISLKKNAYLDYLRAYFLYKYDEMILFGEDAEEKDRRGEPRGGGAV